MTLRPPISPPFPYTTLFRSSSDGTEQEFDLRGDQWQLDARIIKWQGFVAAMGVKPGYRLDRISGRYYTLEDERSAERTRSEERRVGKECRERWEPEQGRRKEKKRIQSAGVEDASRSVTDYE